MELAFPMTAVFVGYIKFGNVLTQTQWLGAVIVTLASAYVIRNEANMKRAKSKI